MPAFTSILCALDASALAPRVLRHAVGLAAVCGARLTVLTATGGDDRTAHDTVTALLAGMLPAAGSAGPVSVQAVHLALGQPVDAILDHARDGVDLIVAGTHGKSGLSRWLLGSTSAALLADAACPVLLVPPGELYIVTLGDTGAALRPGSVLAAVDLDEHNAAQLAVASALAALAGQPLVLMTVAPAGTDDATAEQALRERSHGLGPAPVARVLVRRGAVAAAIDHAAVAEHAGLVVMGLRARALGTPGAIATAVLEAKDAVVLAVPAARAVPA